MTALIFGFVVMVLVAASIGLAFWCWNLTMQIAGLRGRTEAHAMMIKDLRLPGGDDGKRIVLFHREGGFYPVEIGADDDLTVHVEANPGTLKITDALSGKLLWAPS